MQLREWQEECIEAAYNKYLSGSKHFLALATPGAGKTHMASSLAEKLIEYDMIDLVICFAPSTIVANDFEEILSMKLNARFDGLYGSAGLSSTYQNLQYIDDSFWKLFKRFRVLVIFDEIHHCSGSSIESGNAWGEKIIEHIQDQATYTIALTGTPWRSDKAPIVLSNYCSKTHKIICDYRYGLKEAITDNVCRMPQIIAIDNDQITVTKNDEQESYNSFLDLFSQSVLPFKEIIENDVVIEQLLTRANKKLQCIRKSNPNAGGLIIASSVNHANQIHSILKDKIGKNATIVTYKEDMPSEIIRDYRISNEEWIISVGMISEGTNIPRLQVCCHLTNIKTEMHYRQILGRILRVTKSQDQTAVLYMLVEPKLVEYAYRVSQDIPDAVDIVQLETFDMNFKNDSKNSNSSNIILKEDDDIQIEIANFDNPRDNYTDIVDVKNPLTESYEKMVNIFGRYKEESLRLNIFTL